MHLLRLLSFLWVSFAATRAAAAASPTMDLRVTLAVPEDQAPTHVCVLSAYGAGTPTTIEALNKTHANLCSRAPRGEPKCGTEVVWGAESFYFRWPEQHEPPRGDALLEGLRGLSKTFNQHQCTYGESTGCLPLFSFRGIEKPRQAYMTCVENTANRPPRMADEVTDKPYARALLLSLSTQQEAGPYIQGLQLNGRNLLITTKRVTGVDHIVRVLGGFYAPVGEARIDEDDRPLPIEARCQWTTIGIPRIASTAKKGASRQNLPVKIGLVLDTGDGAVKPVPRDYEDIKQCVSGSLQDTTLRVLIPHEPKYRKVLAISGTSSAPPRDPPKPASRGTSSAPPPPTRAAPELATWQLEASWLVSRPPSGEDGPGRGEDGQGRGQGRLNAVVRRLTFSWRPDACLYPQGECPVAKVSTSGLPCTSLNKQMDPETKLCGYQCDAAGETNVDFPTRISFSNPPTPGVDDSAPYLGWSVDIRTIDQQLQGYVDPEERAIPLSTADWRKDKVGRKREDLTIDELRAEVCPDGRSHDDVFYVEFMAGDRRHRVELYDIDDLECGKREQTTGSPIRPRPIVKLPRVSCDEPILYRYVGERAYHTDAISVKNGELRLPPPMASARWIHFGIAVLPASFQFIVAPRPLSAPVSGGMYAPALEGSVVFKPTRPALRGWRFNVDVTFTGGSRPYLALGNDDGTSNPEPRRSTYARWFIGGSVVSPWMGNRRRTHYLGPAAALGAGLQLGLGYPITRAEANRLGGVTVGLVALRFDLRVRLHRYIEAMVSARALFGDEMLRFVTDVRGQPQVERTRGMISLWPLGGFAFVW